MITKLQLKNFQCHKSLTLDLSQRVTTIVGSSDVGKSAIIRALQWVCFNRPSGDQFRKHGEKDVGVRLTVDGKSITRYRSRSSNSYRINKRMLKAFGATVPESITTHLQIGAFNFQAQHDSPFWLSLSPGEVGRRLNSIVNLEVIDQVLKKNSRRLKHLNMTVEVRKQQAQEQKEQIDGLAWVEDAKLSSNRINMLSGLLQRDRLRVSQLEAAIDAIEEIERRRRPLRGLIVTFPRIQKLYHTLDHLIGRAGHLEVTIRKIEGEQMFVQEKEYQLQEAESKLAKIMAGKCPLCGRKDK